MRSVRQLFGADCTTWVSSPCAFTVYVALTRYIPLGYRRMIPGLSRLGRHASGGSGGICCSGTRSTVTRLPVRTA